VQGSETELGYLAHPEGAPQPGVVMIHDVWGLSDHTRDLARRLAQEGFCVLAVDLYRRLDSVAIANPGEWMRALSDPVALDDVQAGIDFLAQEPAARGRRIGVTGFCMGGMYALLAACACRGLSAGVAFYGLLSHEHGILYDERGLDPARKPRQPLDAAAELRCPLLAFYGERDEFVPASDVERLRQALASARHPAEVVVYPGAGHAFMNDTRPDAWRPAVAADAWKRMLGFFRERLA
jgi:carboxymethylenebutenolidase